MNEPATREILKAELDRLFVRLCAAWAAMLALAVAVSHALS
jgi:hypothetical protein